MYLGGLARRLHSPIVWEHLLVEALPSAERLAPRKANQHVRTLFSEHPARLDTLTFSAETKWKTIVKV